MAELRVHGDGMRTAGRRAERDGLIDRDTVFKSGAGIGAASATYNWFPAFNSLDTIQSNHSVGLSKDITGRIFAPTDLAPSTLPGCYENSWP